MILCYHHRCRLIYTLVILFGAALPAIGVNRNIDIGNDDVMPWQIYIGAAVGDRMQSVEGFRKEANKLNPFMWKKNNQIYIFIVADKCSHDCTVWIDSTSKYFTI